MTVKSTVSFTDRHHTFAQQKAAEGRHASVSSVVAAGIERLMQDEEEREIALSAMAQTIRNRVETPREEWIEGVDDMLDAARKHLTARQNLSK